jgi:hypothetical protein
MLAVASDVVWSAPVSAGRAQASVQRPKIFPTPVSCAPAERAGGRVQIKWLLPRLEEWKVLAHHLMPRRLPLRQLNFSNWGWDENVDHALIRAEEATSSVPDQWVSDSLVGKLTVERQGCPAVVVAAGSSIVAGRITAP